MPDSGEGGEGGVAENSSKTSRARVQLLGGIRTASRGGDVDKLVKNC